MPPDPLAEALALLADDGARGELEAAVAAFLEAERIARCGPVQAARLAAVARAATLLADAAGDPDLLAELPEPAGLDTEALANFGRQARQAQRSVEAALSAPPARWQLLQRLAATWTARGHKLGSGDGGRFHRFAQAVGDAAGVEVTHHSIRQVCAKWTPKDRHSHTADRLVAA